MLVGNTKSRVHEATGDVYAVDGRGQSYTEKKSARIKLLQWSWAAWVYSAFADTSSYSISWTILFLYTYTSYGFFANLGRPYVWLFLLISIVFTILLFWVVLRWKRVALVALKMHHGIKRRRSQNVSGILRLRQAYRDTIGINGKFYLWKLHLRIY